jgi:peptidylprolyl isomerase
MSAPKPRLLLPVGALLGALAVSYPSAAVHGQDYPPGIYAELTTNKGIIVLALDLERTPMTVANFVGLAEGTIENDAFPFGTPFFDGTEIHRVAPGHVIQAGIPASDTVRGPGYRIPNEIHPELGHGRPGMVGMANGGPHTAASQFYITLGDRSYLDGDYAVFGEVVRSMETVLAMEEGDVIETVRIVRVGAEAEAFQPTTDSFREKRREVWRRARAQEQRERETKEAFIQRTWAEAAEFEWGGKCMIVEAGFGSRPEVGDVLQVRYAGRTLAGLNFASTAPDGRPVLLAPGTETGEVFDFVVGESSVNPGFDEAVNTMRRGEKRMIVIPPEKGYDPVGYYGPSRAGEPRFVIRPRSFLVYEIEVLEGEG